MLASFFDCQTFSVPLRDVDGVSVSDCPDYTRLSLEDEELGRQCVDQVAILKLNGGLGTTMGCNGPKSLIPVFGTITFLDIIFRQVDYLRQSTGVQVPLFLMDSFATHNDTHTALNGFDCRLFLQHQVPRIDAELMEPVSFPSFPNQEWAPPGHGDVFWSIYDLGILDAFLADGIRYLFISNSDNLGASFDMRILGMMARQRLEMVMEVAERTALDVKGGTIVRRGGCLKLLERAQVLESELPDFEDIHRFSVFNTNSIWVDLQVLKTRLIEHRFELPVIVNPKTVEGKSVIQLEMAMGAAIEIFDRVQLLHVPRSRFLPVKKMDDLTRLRSVVQGVSNFGKLLLST